MADDTFISPARRRLVESFPCYHPFGGMYARNVLKDYKGSQSKETKILFLGCYDLHNTLTTVASNMNSGQLIIYLNHPCLLSFARNVLILKVISAPHFNVANADDLNYLWDLWYNVKWSQTTMQKFVKDIESLVQEGLSDQHSLDSSQIKNLKNVWKSWLLALKGSLTQPSKIKNILEDRSEFIASCGMGKELAQIAAAHGDGEFLLAGEIKRYATWCEAVMETDDYPITLQKKLFAEAKAYFETGTCNSTKLLKTAAINPTLLEPKTLRWWVEVSSCPFYGYLPLSLSDLETNAEEGIATRFCQNKLKTLVTAFRQVKKNVQFHFNFGEDLKFCHIGTSEKFDVVDSSSLADDLGLANVMAFCIERLDLSPNSLLITESCRWGSLAPTVLQYVEESLCAPLSMIPTLYGLRLADHVELGSATFIDQESPTGSPHKTLTWQQAPRFENVLLGSSSSLEVCLKKLERRCYFMEDQKNPLDKCGLKCYTPLTYYYVASNLAHRSGVPNASWLKFSHTKLAPQFIATQNTLDSWANCSLVKLVTSAKPFTAVEKHLFQEAQSLYPAPMLRLILIPTDDYLGQMLRMASMGDSEGCPIVWAAKSPNVHYIDNFILHYNKSSDCSIHSVHVSFVLPCFLIGTQQYSAALIDLMTGTTLMYIGEFQDMKKGVTKRIPPSNTKISAVALHVPYMQAVTCEESKNNFAVKIDIKTNKEDPKGLNISTDRLLPCEAAHRITFSLAQPEGVSPLTLCFPYPVLVDCISATLRRSDCSILVSLPKALNEPWPCHFDMQPKWNVSNFIHWTKIKSTKDSSVLLMYHVGAQKNLQQLEKVFQFEERRIHLPEYRLLPPLEIARNAIEMAFAVVLKGCEYFSVCNVPDSPTENLSNAIKDHAQKQLFTIRAHPPFLISPTGSPMLLISVLDHCLSKKLVENGHIKAKQAEEDFKRIFRPKKKTDPMILWSSENSIHFLRYLFRLNSTKMRPSSWQENNLPLGKYSPYLATFISPLYLENMFPGE